MLSCANKFSSSFNQFFNSLHWTCTHSTTQPSRFLWLVKDLFLKNLASCFKVVFSPFGCMVILSNWWLKTFKVANSKTFNGSYSETLTPLPNFVGWAFSIEKSFRIENLFILVFTRIHRCVFSTVYTVLTRVLWKQPQACYSGYSRWEN